MKFTYLVGMIALTLTFGCNNQPAEEQVKVPAEEQVKVIEKETTKVVEVEAPAKKVAVEQEKGTSIEIGPEGGSIKTKKVDIKVNN